MCIDTKAGRASTTPDGWRISAVAKSVYLGQREGPGTRGCEQWPWRPWRPERGRRRGVTTALTPTVWAGLIPGTPRPPHLALGLRGLLPRTLWLRASSRVSAPRSASNLSRDTGTKHCTAWLIGLSSPC